MVKRTFSIIFRNFKLFLPLFVMGCLMGLLAIGTTQETLIVINVLILLTLWLVTLFFVRRIVRNKKVRFFVIFQWVQHFFNEGKCSL